MPLRLPKVLLLAVAGLAVAAGVRLRNTYLKVPHIRVGPLESQVTATEPLRLFVLGDFGSGNAAQLQVAAAMEQRCQVAKPAAILLLGDNFYMNGVESVEDPQWQSKLLDPYGSECLEQLPFYPVLGNHDYKGNPAAQIEYTLINPRWRFPNRFYSVQFDRLLRLIAYDTEASDVCFRPAFCSTDFLLDAASRQDTAWTIAMGHHPLRTASLKDEGGHRSGPRGWLLTPLLCHDVDLYLAGHAHHLEHRRVDGCRLELVVAGGGGAELSGVSDDAESLFARSTYGFAELELTSQTLTIRFFDANATILHEATRRK